MKTSKWLFPHKKGKILIKKEYRFEKSLKDFFFSGVNAGIKNNDLDLALVYSPLKCSCAALFTKNSFPGAPLVVAKEKIFSSPDPKLRAIVINSKNANVYTGKEGENHVVSICKKVAKNIGVTPWNRVMMSSTGIIGSKLPVEKIEKKISLLCKKLGQEEQHLKDFASAIMTTDKKRKMVRVRLSFEGAQSQNDPTKSIEIIGIAKGAGMIEPNMATMLCYLFTNAKISSGQIKSLLSKANEKSFNALSIDGDTSTSDTLAMMASGTSSFSVPLNYLQHAVDIACIDLAKQIACDGEGISKLIELEICGAASKKIADLYGKSVINSLLFKTAVEGADPNWGRIVMALGKIWQHPIKPSQLRIFFGRSNDEVEMKYENQDDASVKKRACKQLSLKKVYIRIKVGNGSVKKTFLGNSLSKDYIKFNADYTS